MYGCENWSLILRQKRRLRIVGDYGAEENIWYKGDEVTGEWRKLHDEGLNDLSKYFSGNQIRMNEIGWACRTYG